MKLLNSTKVTIS